MFPRWAINRHATFDVSYTLFRLHNHVNERTSTLFANFTLKI